MKKIALLVIFLIQLKIIQGQNNPGGVFLSTLDKIHLFYIELNGESGTVFNLGNWLDKAGTAYSIIYTDTLIKQADTSNFLYEGRKTKIERVDNKLYLVATDNYRKKPKKIEIGATSNTDLVNSNINNAYWWDNFLKLCKNIDSAFELYHYSFRNGFTFWKSFDNKGIYHQDFRIFADNRLKILKDSITSIQTPYVLVINEVIKNIATIDYSSLKDSVSKLPAEYSSQSGYFGTIINSICNNRPELFFKLAEDMPDKKNIIFGAVNNKECIRKLKTIETNSTAKKEFFKERKKDKVFVITAITTSLVGLALLGSCMYVLIK